MGIFGKIVSGVAKGAAKGVGTVAKSVGFVAKGAVKEVGSATKGAAKKVGTAAKVGLISGVAHKLSKSKKQFTIGTIKTNNSKQNKKMLTSFDSEFKEATDYYDKIDKEIIEVGKFKFFLIYLIRNFMISIQDTYNFPDLSEMKIDFHVQTFSFEEIANFLNALNEIIDVESFGQKIANEKSKFDEFEINLLKKFAILGFDDNDYFLRNNEYVFSKVLDVKPNEFDYDFCMNYFDELEDEIKNYFIVLNNAIEKYVSYQKDVDDLVSEKNDFNNYSKIENKVINKIYCITIYSYKLISLKLVDYTYEEVINKIEMRDMLRVKKSVIDTLDFS